MAITTSIPWIITIRGDGKATELALSIASSPAFSGCVQLESKRAQQPTSVTVDTFAAASGYETPMLTEARETHDMIDGEVEVETLVRTEKDGAIVENTETRMVKRKVPGPTYMINLEIPGETPKLPELAAKMSAAFDALVLVFAEPVREGAEVVIAGRFHYELGGSA